MNNEFKNMDKERKTALIVLSIFSLIIVVALFLNLYGGIRNPLDYKKIAAKKASNNPPIVTDINKENLSSDNTELKTKDTDSDGISDWDELFIYATSPYLEDSDGDGLSDYEEIYVYKTNPNCPEGQTCSGALIQGDLQSNASASSSLGGFYDILSDLENLNDEIISPAINSSSTQSVNPEVTPTQLRSLLLENGFSKEDLDAFSDADLLEIFKEASAEI